MNPRTVFRTIVALALVFSFQARADSSQKRVEPLLTPEEAAQVDAMTSTLRQDKSFNAWFDCVWDRADRVRTLAPELAIKVALTDCWNLEMTLLGFMLGPPLSLELPRAVKGIANMRDKTRLALLKEFEQGRRRGHRQRPRR
jgi:hypothetical protein